MLIYLVIFDRHPRCKSRPVRESSTLFSFSISSTFQPLFFRIFFQVPYTVSPLFLTLTKTAGGRGDSSHFGTARRPSAVCWYGGSGSAALGNLENRLIWGFPLESKSFEAKGKREGCLKRPLLVISEEERASLKNDTLKLRRLLREASLREARLPGRGRSEIAAGKLSFFTKN